MYLKAFEHSLDIPDSLKIINTGLLYISLPVFLAKNVNILNIIILSVYVKIHFLIYSM